MLQFIFLYLWSSIDIDLKKFNNWIVSEIKIPKDHFIQYDDQNNKDLSIESKDRRIKNVLKQSPKLEKIDDKEALIYKDNVTILLQIDKKTEDPFDLIFSYKLCSQTRCFMPSQVIKNVNLKELQSITKEEFSKKLNYTKAKKIDPKDIKQKLDKLVVSIPYTGTKPEINFFSEYHPYSVAREYENSTINVYIDFKKAITKKITGKLVVGEGDVYDLEFTPFKNLLWPVLIMALLGGLLLNIMPCVLPVISLKALSLIKYKSNRIYSSIGYSLGNISTFVAFGVFLALFKSSFGWGFQMQMPLFIYFLLIVFLILSLNLWGFFEFIGISIVKQTRSAFLNGVLATVVATPCTAPFMGVALSYALTQTMMNTILVFTFLGLGMSFPILLLAILPFSILPHPGKWLEYVKPIFGFILFGTVIWLLYLLTALTSNTITFWVSIFLLFISFIIWLKSRKIISTFLTFVLVFIFGFSGILTMQFNPVLKHEIYTPEKLEQLINNNNKVLIYVTADWCLACQVNSKIINSKSIQDILKKQKITYMIADWTKKDDVIRKFLQDHNIFGIPCTIYKTKTTTKVLPGILTQKAIMQAIDTKTP